MGTVAEKIKRSYRGPACPYCKKPISQIDIFNQYKTCRFCNKAIDCTFYTQPKGKKEPLCLEASAPDSVSNCANHERNIAQYECERCGSFICSLCSVSLSEKQICSNCFEKLSSDKALPELASSLRDHAFRAFSMILISILAFYFAQSLSFLFFMFYRRSFQGWLMGSIFLFYVFGVVFAIIGLREKKKRKEKDGRMRLFIALILNCAALVLYFIFLYEYLLYPLFYFLV